jgi:hypothetical protein
MRILKYGFENNEFLSGDLLIDEASSTLIVPFFESEFMFSFFLSTPRLIARNNIDPESKNSAMPIKVGTTPGFDH